MEFLHQDLFESLKIPAVVRAQNVHFSIPVSVLQTSRLPEDLISKSNTPKSLQISPKKAVTTGDPNPSPWFLEHSLETALHV